MKLATSTLLMCVAALLALGMVMLYSSSMADKGHFLTMQSIWCVLGLVAGLITASMDYRLLKRFAWPIFIFAVLLLLLVLVPRVGYKINGARRWFKLGGIGQFEPSELGKIALIIMVAWYGDHCQRRMGEWKRGFWFPSILIGAALGPIFVEPDRGTTLLLAAVAGVMLLVAGMRWKFVAILLVIGTLGIGISMKHDTMRNSRVDAWLHPEKHKMDIGYQANQAKLALGAGGWTGLGLGNSREKFGFLPEHNTDFIFSIIGEELGLAGTMPVVVAFVLLMICGLYISGQASDTFGLLLGIGITFLIGLQAFINMGVVTSLLPNKGLPLPFISYGGSSLLMMLAGVGILLSIARRGRVPQMAANSSLAAEGLPSPQPT